MKQNVINFVLAFMSVVTFSVYGGVAAPSFESIVPEARPLYRLLEERKNHIQEELEEDANGITLRDRSSLKAIPEAQVLLKKMSDAIEGGVVDAQQVTLAKQVQAIYSLKVVTGITEQKWEEVLGKELDALGNSAQLCTQNNTEGEQERFAREVVMFATTTLQAMGGQVVSGIGSFFRKVADGIWSNPLDAVILAMIIAYVARFLKGKYQKIKRHWSAAPDRFRKVLQPLTSVLQPAKMNGDHAVLASLEVYRPSPLPGSFSSSVSASYFREALDTIDRNRVTKSEMRGDGVQTKRQYLGRHVRFPHGESLEERLSELCLDSIDISGEFRCGVVAVRDALGAALAQRRIGGQGGRRGHYFSALDKIGPKRKDTATQSPHRIEFLPDGVRALLHSFLVPVSYSDEIARLEWLWKARRYACRFDNNELIRGIAFNLQAGNRTKAVEGISQLKDALRKHRRSCFAAESRELQGDIVPLIEAAEKCELKKKRKLFEEEGRPKNFFSLDRTRERGAFLRTKQEEAASNNKVQLAESFGRRAASWEAFTEWLESQYGTNVG